MNLYIPSLGTQLVLAEAWTFSLVSEQRNDTLAMLLGIEWALPQGGWSYRPQMTSLVTLPAGTVLAIDRYYIRQGKSEYDSVTFNLVSHPELPPTKKSKIARFWVHLRDANYIQIEEIVS